LIEGLELVRSIGYRTRECTILSNLGSVKTRRNDFELAEHFLVESLKITETIQFKGFMIYIMSQLAGMHMVKKDTQKAFEYLYKALPLTKQIGTPYMKAHLYRNFGEATGKIGEYKQSINYFNQALSIAQSIKENYLVYTILAEAGENYLKHEQIDVARDAFEELKILIQNHESKELELEGTAYYGLARVCKLQGQISEARKFGEMALEIFEFLDDPRVDEVKRFLKRLSETDNGRELKDEDFGGDPNEKAGDD
jgi:tetratricopeptide (TPR) repeat protein